jgi:hypothetical protein
MKAVILVTAIMSLLIAALAGCGSDAVEGTVAHKAITGVKDGTTYTILVNKPDDGSPRIQVKDEAYEGYFDTGAANAVVTDSLEELMKQKYSEIRYVVNVRANGVQDGTLPYYASRDIFNDMMVGSETRFRTSGGDIPRIVEILESTELERSGVLQGDVTIGPIWPVEPPGGSPPIPPEVYQARKVVVYDESGAEALKIVDIIPGGERGHYRVELAPGTYVVDINHLGIDSSDEVPARIEITSGQTVNLDIDIDTGIR